MKKMLLAVLLLSAAAVLSAAGFQGPFSADGLIFFFVHNGGPLKLTVEAIPAKNAQFPKALAAFYDANEHKVAWNYETLKPNTPQKFIKDYGKNAPKGVYQIRVALMAALCKVYAEPDEKFGVMPVRSTLRVQFPEQFKTAYIYVSPHAKKEFTFKHRFGEWELFTADGQTFAKCKKYNPDNQKLSTDKVKDQVLKLTTKMRRNAPFMISTDNFPLILCPDAETAKTIAGDYWQAKDKTWWPGRFQAEIHDWMMAKKAEDFKVNYIPLKAKKAEWMAEENGLALLRGSQLYLKALLDKQNLDPKSPNYGEVPGRNYVTLALAAGLKRPVNPYYNDRVMKNRAMAGLFFRYLKFGQNGTIDDNDNSYAGLDAFEGHKMTQCVYFMRDVLTKEEKELLSEGICRTVDRFAFFHASCENQSSHWLMAFQNLGESGLAVGDYTRLAKDYLTSLDDVRQNPFMKTGYQEENYGPDATYQGLGACFQANYYRRTNNNEAKEGLRKIYNLFNHSIAPEPDGKFYGCSGFSQRTQGTWVHRQWGAGTAMMKGVLPEAAALHQGEKPAGTINWDKELREQNNPYPPWLIYASEVWTSLYSGYFHPCTAIPGAKLPVMQSNRFAKDFNREFLAVRKPAYYVFGYTGTTRHKWTRGQVRRVFNSRNKKDSWNTVQGLHLIWSPEYGTLMASHCWNAATYNMVSAELNDGKYAIPDYWTLQFNFTGKELSLFNRLFDQPVTISRKVFFEEKRIREELVLKVEKDWTCKQLYEQIPLLEKKGMKLTINGHEVRVVNEQGKGFLLKFKGDIKKIESFQKQSHFDYSLLPLRIHFGNSFKQNQTLKLSYTIEPVK